MLYNQMSKFIHLMETFTRRWVKWQVAVHAQITGREDVYCLFSSLQEVNADEFEDKEWTFVIEGVSISNKLFSP